MRLPLVTSHAACKGHAPENTLAGIERAIALGADAIEIDVHCTADRVPVLIHDELVDRTTDGAGSIHELPLAVARALDAGARQFVPRFQGEKIPTLAEVIDLTKGKVLLQIEIKQPDIEDDVPRVVRHAGALADCETHSFWPQVVKRMREVEPRMAAALLTDGRRVVDWADFFGFALSLNAQGISVYHAFATPETVRLGQRRSLTFMTWTVDDEADMEKMVAAGVDSICSNARTSSSASSCRGRAGGAGRALLRRVAVSYTSVRRSELSWESSGLQCQGSVPPLLPIFRI
jgi:glycerophosphoryl diester phosphodiesterase